MRSRGLKRLDAKTKNDEDFAGSLTAGPVVGGRQRRICHHHGGGPPALGFVTIR